jgi:hypothetical protein
MHALVIFLFLLVPANAKDVVIRNDGGGFVDVYAEKYIAIRQSGARVVIDGWCASACTIALAVPNRCVTSRAVMGFHSGYTFGWFGDWSKWTDPNLTAYFMSQYPKPIRQWLNARGGLTTNLKYLRAKELWALGEKRC